MGIEEEKLYKRKKSISIGPEFVGYIHLNENDFCGISVEEKKSISVINGTSSFEICRGENHTEVAIEVLGFVLDIQNKAKQDGINFRSSLGISFTKKYSEDLGIL